MTRRVAVAMLAPTGWTPPGVDPFAWRTALAEDAVDLLATLAGVDAAVAVAAVDRDLAEAVVWPGMAILELPALTVGATLAALDGYDQAVLCAADAPDLPAMLLGKLFRPLGSHPVAVSPAEPGPGLLGLATRLPPPGWLPDAFDPNVPAVPHAPTGSTVPAVPDAPTALDVLAGRSAEVQVVPGWRRQRGPADLAALDPGLEGWEATRRLLLGG
ncbi:hypothetical protein ACK8GG_17845 [Micromonosporaceae bacterium DT55]|uniref:hypothetical protein n=1 Tax=Melissospora conviva TaxID=3388432 RepID=UPI003C244AF8